jgi:hypothetical protein
MKNNIIEGRANRHRIPSDTDRLDYFIANHEPAISGQGGHTQVYEFVRTLVVEFKLPISTVWKFLCSYNRQCQPRWSKSELVHKIADGYKLVGQHYLEADLMAALPFMTTGEGLGSDDAGNIPAASSKPYPHLKPSRNGFGPGTNDQLQCLADLRGISLVMCL